MIECSGFTIRTVMPEEQKHGLFDKSSYSAELSRLEADPEYKRLLDGRSVIVVGPAKTLIGSNLGRTIDSYDLVVRFNTVIEYLPFPGELSADIGTRTDIIYFNNEVMIDDIIGQRRIKHERFINIARQLQMKYLICTNNGFSFDERLSMATNCQDEEARFRQFLVENNLCIGFRMLYQLPALVRSWLRGHVGRTGFMAIADLLSYDISRLHISGMTFYHAGGHLFLKDSISELHPLGNHRGEMPSSPDILGHNSYLELEAMRKLANEYGEKLLLDADVKNLL